MISREELSLLKQKGFDCKCVNSTLMEISYRGKTLTYISNNASNDYVSRYCDAWLKQQEENIGK